MPHSHAAAAKAVELARAGEVEALMKGSLHSDELLGAVVNTQCGLRTERRISHVFVLDVPRYPKPLLITDAAINVAPDFDAKVDIVQNAIDLAHALGIARPKVAILSAVETVTPKLRSSMDAAALSKMADRGQITGGLVDGPLAFDNAVSLAAAKTKGIESEVAGDADILVVPDLESGNMLAKQLEYLGGAQAAGLVMGAQRAHRADQPGRLGAFAHRLVRHRPAADCPPAQGAGGTGMTQALLVINSGSSSVKFAAYDVASPIRPWRASPTAGSKALAASRACWCGGRTARRSKTSASACRPTRCWGRKRRLKRCSTGWAAHAAGRTLLAVGHRVVHGGERFARPALVTPEILAQLDGFTPLAPLHQPHNLSAIRAIASLLPELPQVACFDTEFHATQPWVAQACALPRHITEAA